MHNNLLSLALYEQLYCEMDSDSPVATSTPKKSYCNNYVEADSSILCLSDSDQDTNFDESLLFLDEGAVHAEPITREVMLYSSVNSSDDDQSTLLFFDETYESKEGSTVHSLEDVIEDEISPGRPLSYSQLVDEPCCESHCLHHMSPAEMKQAREHFDSKTSLEKKQYLLDCTLASITPLSSGTIRSARLALVMSASCTASLARECVAKPSLWHSTAPRGCFSVSLCYAQCTET